MGGGGGGLGGGERVKGRGSEEAEHGHIIKTI